MAKALSHLFLLVAAPAEGTEVELCNAAPVQSYVATAYRDDRGFRTRGWYAMEPGACTRFEDVQGEAFFYFAESRSELAKWISGTSGGLVWSGPHQMCVDPSEAFERNYDGCKTTRGFHRGKLSGKSNRLTLLGPSRATVSEAPEVARILRGRMAYEALLLESEGREAPFQIGIGLRDVAQGLQITRIHPGMPGEELGLQVGDYIVEFDGIPIGRSSTLVTALDEIPLSRTTPLPISVRRSGEVFDGELVPAFFPFNHKNFTDEAAQRTTTWSFFDGVTFGFLNELGCGLLMGVDEALSSSLDERDYDTRVALDRAAECARGLDFELLEHQLLHKREAMQGDLLSWFVPGPKFLKGVRAGRGLPIAARALKRVRPLSKVRPVLRRR
ncbi:MAG: DUF1036 domain-containing protein [Deltaproteobacteria bacterium]|jgi:uncharacterized membrane protein